MVSIKRPTNKQVQKNYNIVYPSEDLRKHGVEDQSRVQIGDAKEALKFEVLCVALRSVALRYVASVCPSVQPSVAIIWYAGACFAIAVVS